MKENNELFELCKQVYKATGWGDTDSIINSGGDRTSSGYLGKRLYEYFVPLYTSDYLLEKLPKKIKRDSSTGWLVLSPMDSQGAWSVGYEPDHTEHIDDYPMEWGESPVAALLKLTLKLHEEEIL